MDLDSKLFVACLREGSPGGLQFIPKSDLHNHAGRGGSLNYIADWAHARISPPKAPFASLDNMQEWFEQNIKAHCPGLHGYLKRVEAAFAQAGKDSVTRLALSFGMGEIETLGGMKPFMQAMDALHDTYAPNATFLPELALDRACDTEQVFSAVEEILSYKWLRPLISAAMSLPNPSVLFRRSTGWPKI
jgi:adenosine deaminase